MKEDKLFVIDGTMAYTQQEGQGFDFSVAFACSLGFLVIMTL